MTYEPGNDNVYWCVVSRYSLGNVWLQFSIGFSVAQIVSLYCIKLNVCNMNILPSNYCRSFFLGWNSRSTTLLNLVDRSRNSRGRSRNSRGRPEAKKSRSQATRRHSSNNVSPASRETMRLRLTNWRSIWIRRIVGEGQMSKINCFLTPCIERPPVSKDYLSVSLEAMFLTEAWVIVTFSIKAIFVYLFPLM